MTHTLKSGTLAALPLKIFLPMVGFLSRMNLLKATRESERWLRKVTDHLICTGWLVKRTEVK